MNELTDDSPMPYGTHEGTPMKEISASYFLWMWEEGGMAEDTNAKWDRRAVRNYIRDNLSVLESECPDYIVTKRPKE